MAEFTLVIGNKNYSSWSLRGWLMTRIAGVEFEYDRFLRSHPGREVDQVDSGRRVLKVLSHSDPRPGQRIPDTTVRQGG